MPKNQIKKALIPAAGFGTRLFPATKVVKKELFPIIDQDGRVKPVIQLIVEEAISAGIEEIGIIVQPEDKRIFIDLFKYPPKAELFEKLSPENQKHSKYIVDLGDRIKFLSQKEQAGYGHAVYCAKEWVNNQPFLLMLGDHIYASDIKKSCARQVLEVYAQQNQNVVGLTKIPAEIIHKAGCVTGVWQKKDSILSLTQIYEKPTVEYARQHLRVEGIAENEFLSIFGLYALTPRIFDFLEENINHNFRERGEFQLTTCLEKVRQVEGMVGYIVQGQSFDIGMPDAYLQTLIDFRNR
ncbi:UTP--glucose-1-phosphate uridylyltransferase [Fischerella thermalis CCMEE 5268]|uniref:UTP--glucose-1-phosphate uridylyltransferase n=1 Tax=Fischerella thermalis CCMEE 5268 TaxID=2019662 RepID=A0A2N6KGN5_9CYAN|nr:UTP--glucose-1-phosphate uridylyltransferase [Fischerella thermalis]PLZ98431.1 UTP--glucose-1-phosphate uridylyltransferase [Fischerella thermalis CCMEE 5268]